jgi:hypothetical protein
LCNPTGTDETDEILTLGIDDHGRGGGKVKDKKFIYDTFCLVVEKEFLPILDHESDGYCWLPLGVQPKPLHHKSKQLVQNSSFMSKLVNMEKWLDQHVND